MLPPKVLATKQAHFLSDLSAKNRLKDRFEETVLGSKCRQVPRQALLGPFSRQEGKTGFKTGNRTSDRHQDRN